MKARLLLLACVLCLSTSLTVPSAFLLNALEARLFLLGQAIMVWELYCRGESWKLLSVNIAALCFLFTMCFNISPTIPSEPTNIFIILSLIYLGLTILIVDPLKHTRSLLVPSTPPPVDPFACIEWQQLPLYAPHIFRIVDPFEDSDEESNMLQPLPMAQLHGHFFHGDGDSSLSDSSDSDLSTIHEDQNELEEALDEGLLPPHLHWATAG